MFVTIVLILLVVLFLFAIITEGLYYVRHREAIKAQTDAPLLPTGVLGAVALFGDTIGIGSFNTLSAGLKTFHLIDDRDLPGTLMVGTAAVAPLVAFVFVSTIEVSPITLAVLTISATIGSYIGAQFVTRISQQTVQITMSLALCLVAFFILAGQVGWLPVGGELTRLTGVRLVVSALGLFILGALMNFGVGLYAPCLALLFSFGMSAEAVFPIMACACATLQPIASVPILKAGAFNPKAAFTIALFGMPAALLATRFVTSIPTYWLQWVIFVVVLITAGELFHSYRQAKKAE